MPLSLLEARVVAVLVEKQATVADSYPLTLNALVAGCNQKTARDPVIAATDSDVLQAVDALKSLNLVVEVSGSRVSRYEHNIRRVLGVPAQSVALLTLLDAARAADGGRAAHHTASGCTASPTSRRSRASSTSWPRASRRWWRKLARAPGMREQRWAHLLSGEPPADAARRCPRRGRRGPTTPSTPARLAALRAGQRRMADEVALLRRQLARLAAELGVALDDDAGSRT